MDAKNKRPTIQVTQTNDASDSDGIFENKPSILTLSAGQTFETGYGVTIIP
ncbi:hypothetical protein [Tichowtungia aerotolerans]|uniref:Uncharacterized protein n=1 Tax=Tichowtungia aerotolerans TaxID=2697043 RepID=A0A6P1M1S6_9BACT|nr:hypothetical protein [Tichowtungia aerotolerans]QHI68540.1 hypothetical protein GT409_03420 [Tichowtungia aerotolerans]